MPWLSISYTIPPHPSPKLSPLLISYAWSHELPDHVLSLNSDLHIHRIIDLE